MNRIVVDVKNMERDACQLKNILNRIRFLGGRYTLSELCEYHNKSLIPIVAKRPDDIIIDCSTSWSEIEKLII